MSKPLRFLVIFSGWIILPATGCTRPTEPVGATLARIDAQTPESYNQLYDAAAESLRRQWFRLDRQDRTNGIVTTFPETSANWFEVWRPQPSPGYYWWEANLATVQRQATVRIEPAADQGTYDLTIEVKRLRYSLPERQVDNPAAAQRLYSNAAPTSEGRTERASQTARWIPLGRDAEMEERLLADITSRYGTGNMVTETVEVVTTQAAPAE